MPDWSSSRRGPRSRSWRSGGPNARTSRRASIGATGSGGRRSARREREVQIERRSARRLRGLVAVFAAAASSPDRSPSSRRTRASGREREARIATARELTAAAVANLEVDPELSVLLAIEAVAEDALVGRHGAPGSGGGAPPRRRGVATRAGGARGGRTPRLELRRGSS